MIDPTVARLVLFHPAPDAELPRNGGEPLAGIVVGVNGSRSINVAVFDVRGGHHAFTSVPLLQDDDAAPSDSHYAEWMPYQKGQAANAEAAEGPLAKRLDDMALEVDAKFKSLGDWLQPTLKALDERITAILSAPHPANPPHTEPQPGAADSGGVGAAPQGQA
jgi:hypothetical protein